jgi:hypothetical protein
MRLLLEEGELAIGSPGEFKQFIGDMGVVAYNQCISR